MLSSSMPQGSCSNTNICCSRSYKCLCTLCTALHCIGQDLYSLSEHSGKSTHSASCSPYHLIQQTGTQGLQCFFNAICWTVHHLPVFHWNSCWEDRGHTVPHAMWCSLVSSIQWSLTFPYLLGILPTRPTAILLTAPVVSLLSHIHTVPWTCGRKEGAKRLEENARSHRNCRCIYSLLDGTAAIVADIT